MPAQRPSDREARIRFLERQIPLLEGRLNRVEPVVGANVQNVDYLRVFAGRTVAACLGRLRVLVLDSLTNSPISGASVQAFVGGLFIAVGGTGADGVATLAGLPGGTYSVHVVPPVGYGGVDPVDGVVIDCDAETDLTLYTGILCSACGIYFPRTLTLAGPDGGVGTLTYSAGFGGWLGTLTAAGARARGPSCVGPTAVHATDYAAAFKCIGASLGLNLTFWACDDPILFGVSYASYDHTGPSGVTGNIGPDPGWACSPLDATFTITPAANTVIDNTFGGGGGARVWTLNE